MTLYEINNAISDCIDGETGEVIDIEALDALAIERTEKLESIALYIKNLSADAEAIKAEEAALADRRKAKENKAKNLKLYLSNALAGQTMETPRVRLSFRKSKAVEIIDPDALRKHIEEYDLSDCIKYKEPEIVKSAVGKLLKSGEEIPGAQLVENYSLQIK